MEKKWWKSRTLWVNIVSGAVYVGQSLSGIDIIPDVVMVPVMAGLNLLLRAITTKKLTI